MGKLEKNVERYLNEQVNFIGGLTRKFVSPGHCGVADRLVFLPGGVLYIIEVKTERGKESPMQQRERVRMMSLGFNAIILHGKSDVDKWIKGVKQ